MRVREFRSGDEPALHAVFHSAVHDLARLDYSPEQIDAWAPADMDAQQWAQRMRAINPLVVEIEGRIVGYGDVQPDGYIDHLFVSGAHSRRGVGRLLMERIHAIAAQGGIEFLHSNVSRTAQPFFEHFGFRVVEQRTPVVRGVTIANALMRKQLNAHRVLNR